MIILYTTHCPKCVILERKLIDANLEYQVCEDKKLMIDKGFSLLPVLEVNGQIMGFKEAVRWINDRTE